MYYLYNFSIPNDNRTYKAIGVLFQILLTSENQPKPYDSILTTVVNKETFKMLKALLRRRKNFQKYKHY